MSSKATARQMLSAASGNAVGDWLEATFFGSFTATVNITASAATLVAALRFRGTNNSPPGAAEPILSNVVAISALPSGITMASGVLTIASPAASTYAITLAIPQLPQLLQADWAYTSGGGTVSISVQGAGWSLG